MWSSLIDIIGVEAMRGNEPMSEHTSMKVGGPADFFLVPSTEGELVEVIKYHKSNNLPYCIIGNGTNVIVSDEGFRGSMIKIGGGFSGIVISGRELTAGAGAGLSAAAVRAADSGLSGMEEISGIPGSVGGALYMNAGAYGGEMSGIVRRALVYDSADDRIFTMETPGMSLGYRDSVFLRGNRYVILSVTFGLSEGEPEKIKGTMREYALRRNEKQPMEFPSAGSFFKRPEPVAYAGALIEAAGMKGKRRGGAQVSEKHAGFIVNTSGATASDVTLLASDVRRAVFENSGYVLEPEPRLIGFTTGGGIAGFSLDDDDPCEPRRGGGA
jgi:UDP-N-acetylmuramate dehydrogenase